MQSRHASSTPPPSRAARQLDRAIFALLLALIMLAAVPYGAVDPWWEGVFEGAVFALGALWMVEGWLSGSWLVREQRIIVPLVVLVAFAIVQAWPVFGTETIAGVGARMALSADPFETRRFAFKLAALTLAGALLLRYTSSRRRLRALVWTIIAVGVASALFGIVRQTQPTVAGYLLARLSSNSTGYGQFINRNHFAFLMEMALGLALGLLVIERRRRERVLMYAAATLPIWTALVLSNSRGGLLGMFAQLILLALLYLAASPHRARARRSETDVAMSETGDETADDERLPARVRRLANTTVVRVGLVCCLLGAVVGGVVWVGGEPLASRLEAIPGEARTDSSSVRWGDRRVEIWAATWQLIQKHPLTGAGFGAYHAAVTEFHDASGEMALQQAHNDYLELAASGGIVGVALVAWFFIGVAREARGRLRAPDSFRRAACAGALAGMVAVAVHSLVDFGLHITVNALVFVALVVVIVLGERVEPSRVETRRARVDA